MIEEFSAKNFRCLRDARARLTSLHAFIGPNDSGKSTILEALHALANGAAGHHAPTLGVTEETELAFSASGSHYTLLDTESLRSVGRVPREHADANIVHCGPARILRLDPAELRQPSNLITEGNPIDFLNERGNGLAGVYDALQGRNFDDFLAINTAVVALFPTVKRIRLLTPEASRKQLAVELVTGQQVEAPAMSDGLLYYLAFAALPYIRPLGLLLVEEPETGLHPARIREVVRILRDVSTRMQVVMATHSPLVVNELEPDEVSVVTRDPEHGTRIRPISTAANFEERSKVFALGELWLSYANGDDEQPLFEDGTASET